MSKPEWMAHLRTVTNSTDRAQWLQDRRRFIGASEVAALMNANPWKSILDVWHEKLTGESDFEDNFRMQIGRKIEPVILDLAAEWLSEKSEHRWRVVGNRDTVQDPVLPGLAVTVDGFAWPDGVDTRAEPPVIIEAKATSAANEPAWMADGPPEYYWWQVQAQLLAFRRPYAYVAALFGMQRFEMFKIEADFTAMAKLAERVRWFMEAVEERRAEAVNGAGVFDESAINLDPPDWMKAVADAESNRRYALEHGNFSEGITTDLPNQADALLAEIAEAKEAKKEADARIKSAEARLLGMLSERKASIGETPSGYRVEVRTVRLPERTLKASEFRRMYVKKPRRK